MPVEEEPITRLTPQQRHALEVLQEGTGTTRQVADAMLPGRPTMTYDRAHAVLARLERRGLVRRGSVGRAVWSITEHGQEALV